MTKVIGIDEAGRGPALGPLVIGITEWNPGVAPELEDQDLTLRDSKKLSAQQRDSTYSFLKKNLRHTVCSIPAWVISRPDETIPQLEARVISNALQYFDAHDVYSDALGSGNRAHRWIKNEFPERSFQFESGADDTYPAVSAASVLAKVTRDRAISSLESSYGDVGSGYPSDPSTQRWLESWSNKPDWPAFVRTNWSTVQDLEN
ncbi:MAG: ribonuclease HII [bacterium]